jgi:hypothetical protein
MPELAAEVEERIRPAEALRSPRASLEGQAEVEP